MDVFFPFHGHELHPPLSSYEWNVQQIEPTRMAMKPLQIIIQKSPYSVSETKKRLEKSIQTKGMGIFALIDHTGEARRVNMDLQEEVVIIFGDPKIGTFLMQENPLISLELPLRILIWQDKEGATQIAYIDPLSLGESYGIVKHAEILKKMSLGMVQLIDKALRD